MYIKKLGGNMEEKVIEVLNKIRPKLQLDGGDVELVKIENGKVKLRLTGACGTCPMSQLTLKMVIENILKKEIPEIEEVIAV